jgi:hypothetical protein
MLFLIRFQKPNRERNGFGAAADSGRSQRDCSFPRRICQCGEGLAATRGRKTITDFSAGAYEKRAPISTKKRASDETLGIHSAKMNDREVEASAKPNGQDMNWS